MDNEGGNILFEYIYVDTQLAGAFQLPAGVTSINRVMAYFMNHMTPEKNPLPEPGKCTNLTTAWPMFTGSAREDLDVGTVSMTGKNTAGADVTITLDKMGPGIDNIGRKHDLFYQKISPKAGDFLKFNSSYTVNLGGNGPIQATTFTDALFLSENFSIGTPGLEDDGPLKATADYTVTWTPMESSNLPAGAEVAGVTWLVDSKGSPTHMCPVAHSAGTFTIPAATIADYKTVATARGTDPTKVILLRNAIVHRLQPLPNNDANNKRRIDMLTVNCWAQLMNVM